jgi:hypothetical protein
VALEVSGVTEVEDIIAILAKVYFYRVISDHLPMTVRGELGAAEVVVSISHEHNLKLTTLVGPVPRGAYGGKYNVIL